MSFHHPAQTNCMELQCYCQTIAGPSHSTLAGTLHMHSCLLYLQASTNQELILTGGMAWRQAILPGHYLLTPCKPSLTSKSAKWHFVLQLHVPRASLCNSFHNSPLKSEGSAAGSNTSTCMKLHGPPCFAHNKLAIIC